MALSVSSGSTGMRDSCRSHSLALDQILWADCPASDCADRPMSGRDFASPATSSVNHSRGDLTARGCRGSSQRKTVGRRR